MTSIQVLLADLAKCPMHSTMEAGSNNVRHLKTIRLIVYLDNNSSHLLVRHGQVVQHINQYQHQIFFTMASCAPCVFGAASTSLLSYPVAVGTIDVQIIPQVTIGSNGSTATTAFVTSTLAAATQAGGAPVSTVVVTDSNQLTWTTLGATLTYPTTYVDYAAFAGAAATTGCANSLSPSLLTLPPSVPSASLIYPLDNTGALPAGLISFLDGAGGIPAQLNGDQIPQCAPLGPLAISGSISSVVTAIATAASSKVTVTTDIPPPTTFTSERTSSFTSLATIPATQAVTQTSAYVLNTVTGGPVIYSGGVSTSLPAALGQSLGSSASKSLSSVLSSLSSAKASSATITSSQTGVFTNTTSGQTQPSSRPAIPPTVSSGRPSSGIVPSSSKTSGAALYSGAAVRLPVVSNSIIADVFGFLVFMLYI
ncbi:hypothetical protein MRB53_037840 [Persea americana]|nr:hypothetical protein MRB53_037840 [Persea americana]